MAILVADTLRTLGATRQQYLIDHEDTVNLSIANNNNGAGKTLTVIIAGATGSTDPAVFTIPPYLSQSLTGVRMKALIVLGNGANISVVITTSDEQVRIEPINLTTSGPATIITVPNRRFTYAAVYRLATRPYALSNVFAGAGRKQYATIYGNLATVNAELRNVYVAIESASVAGIVVVDFIALTNATVPAGGNPAVSAQFMSDANPSAQMTALALPTTQGTEFALPISSVEWNLGATGAASIVNPPPPLTYVDMLNPGAGGIHDVYTQRPQITKSLAQGYAVTMDVSAALTLKAFVIIVWTEGISFQ